MEKIAEERRRNQQPGHVQANHHGGSGGMSGGGALTAIADALEVLRKAADATELSKGTELSSWGCRMPPTSASAEEGAWATMPLLRRRLTYATALEELGYHADAAAGPLRAAAESDPLNALVALRLGWAELNAGKPRAAHANAARCLQLRPGWKFAERLSDTSYLLI